MHKCGDISQLCWYELVGVTVKQQTFPVTGRQHLVPINLEFGMVSINQSSSTTNSLSICYITIHHRSYLNYYYFRIFLVLKLLPLGQNPWTPLGATFGSLLVSEVLDLLHHLRCHHGHQRIRPGVEVSEAPNHSWTMARWRKAETRKLGI